MTYYKIINGIRYDRGLLEAAERHTKGRGEWRISLEEIQEIFAMAGDGGSYTETERRTLRYIAQQFTLTEPAQKWLNERLIADTGDESNTEKIFQRVVRGEFGLPTMTWQADTEEVVRQLNREGNEIDFAAAVRGAIHAFLQGGMNPLSFQAVVIRRTLSEDYPDMALQNMRDFMNEGGVLFVVPEDSQLRANLNYDLPENLNFDLFWHIGLYIPELSPVLFMASVSRKNAGFYHSRGYISRRNDIEDTIFSAIKQLAQFTRLEWDIDSEEVNRQLTLYPGQNFGEALFGALFIGIFNGESSFSFRDFISQEIWLDPDRDIRDYMREYIETGFLQLLSPEGDNDFVIPENLAPDFEQDWVFGLEMPDKTDVRFIITVSRQYGFESSWNDGFIPEALTLADQAGTVLDEFRLPELQVIIPEGEYEAQRLQFGPDYRTFSSLLRQALNTILHDYLKPYSAFNIVAQVHIADIHPENFDDPLEYRAAIRYHIFNYLKTGSLEFLPIELPDNNPVDGEPIADYWQFFGLLPALSDIGFWVIIPRYPDEGQQPYCYGFN